MNELFSKLSEEQQERLIHHCREIYNIFEEEDNNLAENDMDDFYDSNLYRGIYDVMYTADQWC